jgi:hypothetical protein
MLLAIADHLAWYGNPWSIPFLRWRTQHESATVQ